MKLDKPSGFIGREALMAMHNKPLSRRMVSIVLQDPEPVLWGGETILLDGKPVGDLTSAAYGHTVGAAVGLGYVRREDGQGIDANWLQAGRFE
ncbi:glycine cleavage T C-terminal barrel domain-containing protein, partial [Klebsiella pneumoniae]|uniref:glycine cleavage T C-terminal barrel domain-containing protein n=1 Tax=Klebsiella pneumoniae TaxID=573 RepID=UPI00385204B9